MPDSNLRPVEPPRASMLHGVSLKIISALVFSMMSASVRLLGEDFALGEIIFSRSLFAMLPIFLWLSWSGDLLAAIRTANMFGHMRRGLFGSMGMFCGFTSLTLLPLSESTAIGYASPLITVVLAAVVLKEKVRAYRWSAVAIGFLGVLVMLSPYLAHGVLAQASGLSPGAQKGAIFGLAGAMFSALATIEVRKMTATETTGAIVFYFMLLTTVLGLLTMFAGWYFPSIAWHAPGPKDALLLVLVGVFGGLGQITMTMSFRYADASVIATFDYMSMIWAVAIGWFIFGELPKLVVMIGASIVVGAGLFVIWRERKLGIERDKQQSVTTPPTV